MIRKKRLASLLLIMLAVLLFVGCDSGEEAEDLEQPPPFYLLENGERISTDEGRYCWLEEEGNTFDPEDVGGIGEVCENDTVPDFSESDFVTIDAGGPIVIEMVEPLPDRLTLSLSPPEDVFLEQSRTEISIDGPTVTWEPENVAPGNYILIALGFWRDPGGAAYYFPVTLE